MSAAYWLASSPAPSASSSAASSVSRPSARSADQNNGWNQYTAHASCATRCTSQSARATWPSSCARTARRRSVGQSSADAGSMMRGRRTPHVIGMTACRLTKSAGVRERPSRRADVRHSAVQRPSMSGSAFRTRRTSRATSRASRSSATHVPVIHTGINHRAASHEAASTPVALTITSAPCAGAQEVHAASAGGNESPRRAAHSGSHRGSRRPRSGNVAAVARLTAHSRCRSAADRERRRGTMTCAARRTAVAPITCVCLRAWRAR